MKREIKRVVKASLRSKIQAYAVLTGIVVVVAGIVYWNFYRPVSPLSKKEVKENLHKPLDPSLVCMVNNAYMGKTQIPVPVNGKTYYGCCQGCVDKLNNEESARTAIDPFSGKKVDKSEAYIILMNKEGTVAYFESEANYMAYIKKE